jgi:protease PrsW
VSIAALMALGLAPGLFLLWFYYKKDKLEPEPKWFVFKMFLYGAVAAVPAGIVELPLMAHPFVTIVLVAPVVEETLKFAVVRLTIYRHEEFDEPMDGIVYAAAAALGFASAENAVYLFSASRTPELLSPALAALSPELVVGATFVMRALLSVPGHALWSTIWGYGLGRAKFMSDRRAGRRLVLGALLIAMGLHGLHNLLAVVSPYIGILGLVVLAIVLWRWVNRNIAAALRDSPFQPGLAAAGEAVLAPPGAATAADGSGALNLAQGGPPIDPVP